MFAREEAAVNCRFILEWKSGIFLGSEPKSGDRQGERYWRVGGPIFGFRIIHIPRMAELLEIGGGDGSSLCR